MTTPDLLNCALPGSYILINAVCKSLVTDVDAIVIEGEVQKIRIAAAASILDLVAITIFCLGTLL